MSSPRSLNDRCTARTVAPPDTRRIRCILLKGHDGAHAETLTGFRWERPNRRLVVNPDPVVFKTIAHCRKCNKRAPWCSCGAMDYVK